MNENFWNQVNEIYKLDEKGKKKRMTKGISHVTRLKILRNFISFSSSGNPEKFFGIMRLKWWWEEMNYSRLEGRFLLILNFYRSGFQRYDSYSS